MCQLILRSYAKSKNIFQSAKKFYTILTQIKKFGNKNFAITAGKLVGKNAQLNFGENINSSMLQKLYWIYIFWNLQPIRNTLK